MSEDEARRKWCPFARQGPLRPGSAHCIGSVCMAWRTRLVDPTGGIGSTLVEVGYCGLAGKP